MTRPFALAILVVLLAGCGTTATPEPAPTPTRTFTPTPLPTPTPFPTTQAAPAPMAIPVEADGFTLLVPSPLGFQLSGSALGILDEKGTFVASFLRRPYDGKSTLLATVMDEYLDELTSRGGSLTRGDTSPVTVGGKQGIAVDVKGILFDASIEGRAVAAFPSDDSVFFGIGVSTLGDGEDVWQTAGSAYFDALVSSVKFIEVQH